MAQQAKVPAAKTCGPSSFSGIHKVEGENQLPQMSCEAHIIYAVVHMHPLTPNT